MERAEALAASMVGWGTGAWSGDDGCPIGVTGSIGDLRSSPLHFQAGESEAAIEAVTNRTRRGEHAASQETEKREIASTFGQKPDRSARLVAVVVRFAFPPQEDKPGFTVKLNTLPISGWNGAMVLVPPFRRRRSE